MYVHDFHELAVVQVAAKRVLQVLSFLLCLADAFNGVQEQRQMGRTAVLGQRESIIGSAADSEVRWRGHSTHGVLLVAGGRVIKKKYGELVP